MRGKFKKQFRYRFGRAVNPRNPGFGSSTSSVFNPIDSFILFDTTPHHTSPLPITSLRYAMRSYLCARTCLAPKGTATVYSSSTATIVELRRNINSNSPPLFTELNSVGCSLLPNLPPSGGRKGRSSQL